MPQDSYILISNKDFKNQTYLGMSYSYFKNHYIDEREATKFANADFYLDGNDLPFVNSYKLFGSIKISEDIVFGDRLIAKKNTLWFRMRLRTPKELAEAKRDVEKWYSDRNLTPRWIKKRKEYRPQPRGIVNAIKPHQESF